MVTQPAPFKLDDIQLDGKPPFVFEWDGGTYECRDPSTTDIRRIHDELQGAGDDPAAVLRFLLGDEQYARLDESDALFTGLHLKALTEAWMDHHGTSVPKSSGSPKSSKRIR